MQVTNSHMLVLNLNELFIFQRTEPNMNLDIPNLFSYYQSSFWKNEGGAEQWPWGAVYSKDDNYLWVAYSVDGLRVYNTTNPLELILLRSYTSTDYADFANGPSCVVFSPKDTNILYVGIWGTGIMIFNVQDVMNIVLLGGITTTVGFSA